MLESGLRVVQEKNHGKSVTGGLILIESLHIHQYTSVREQTLQLGRINILIGANGAGKSNIIRTFTLLSAMMSGTLQNAVQQAGGAQALISRRFDHDHSISFTVCGYGQEYWCNLVPDNKNRLLIQDERLCSLSDPFGSASLNLPPSQPDAARPREESRYAIETGDPEASGLKQPSLLSALRNIRTYQIAEVHRLDGSTTCTEQDPLVMPDVQNLAYVIADLFVKYPEHYRFIRDTIRLVVPFFEDFSITGSCEGENTLTLGWREYNTDYIFPMQDLSDGIRRFIVLCTILNSPALPSLIIINEPETGLHPYAIAVLAAQVRSASSRTQLIVATQSVTFINQCMPDDLLVVGRQEGETVVERIDTDEIRDWLNEYSLGELWEHNVIGGRPDR